jgi:type II secretory pathway pseudopilin PulG
MAFTLAEVLITLGVIGIVATLTIPTLMNSINNKHFETAFFENYSILQQATMQVIKDNEGSIKSVFTNQTEMLNAIADKLKVQKTCTAAQSVGNCWASTTRNLTDTNSVAMTTASPAIILANGTFVNVDGTTGWFSSSCALPWYSGNGSTSVCAMINIDVNGFKGPNLMGRDIFQFYQPNAGSLVPNGSPGTDDYGTGTWQYCDSTSSSWYNGIACGGRIIVEGGMKY